MSMFSRSALALAFLLCASLARSDGIQNPGGPSTPVSVANGGTGDTGTAWATFTPSPSCGTATFTVNSAKSKTIGMTSHTVA
jgi:hypothetical protein